MPLVNTSAWKSVYTNWTQGCEVQTNATVVSATQTVYTVYTNSRCYSIGHFVPYPFYTVQSNPFLSTNELAWHYSALYRLRDAKYSPVGITNRNFRYTGFAHGTANDAYSTCSVFFASCSSTGNSASLWATIPHSTIEIYFLAESGYFCTVDMAQCQVSTEPAFTNIPHTAEFYALGVNPIYQHG